MTKNRSALTAVMAIAAPWCGTGFQPVYAGQDAAVAPAQPPNRADLRPLFRSAVVPLTEAPDDGPEVMERAAIIPDLTLLESLRPLDRIRLPLLPDRTFDATVLRATRIGPGRFTLRGRIEGHEHAVFAVSVVHNAVAMVVRIPGESLHIEIRPLEGPIHVAKRIDDTKLKPCGRGHAMPHDPTLDSTDGGEPAGPAPQRRDGTCMPETDSVWDMLVLYTDDVRVAFGGTNAVQAGIQLFVEEANMTYENSGINARMRLVYQGEVSYAESGELGTDLDRLTEGTHGLDVAGILRHNYQADSVMLVLSPSSGCGLAWCCSSGASRTYATTVFNCWGSTFIHEFGHNLGCAHNDENVDCGGCNEFSRGWYFDGDDGVEYGTIMSYIGARFWHFSTPDVTFQGQPVGTENHNNVLTINNRRTWYEAIRQTHFDVWVDFSNTETKPPYGPFDNPFPRIDDAVNYVIEEPTASELPVMHIKAGATAAPVTLSKPMILRACGGQVRIGDAP